jgi:exopolyphosphatase/guanosine-5'-triphosphate,3'-diphosphate pyrophosphatase
MRQACDRVSRRGGSDEAVARSSAIKAISRNRRGLLPYGAVALQETLIAMKASRGSVFRHSVCARAISTPCSALRRPHATPLLTAAGELAILRARLT